MVAAPEVVQMVMVGNRVVGERVGGRAVVDMVVATGKACSVVATEAVVKGEAGEVARVASVTGGVKAAVATVVTMEVEA